MILFVQKVYIKVTYEYKIRKKCGFKMDNASQRSSNIETGEEEGR